MMALVVPEIVMPLLTVPEMTFRVAAVLPPIVLLELPR
jgi:hypothetical protein